MAEGKKLGWGGVFVLVAIGMVLSYFKVSVGWVVGTIVVFYLVVILLGWTSMRSNVRSTHNRTFRWRWSDEPVELDPEAQSELLALGYEPAGTMVSAWEEQPGTEWKVPLYVHRELPIYATLLPLVGDRNPRPALCLLETFFSDHASLFTSFDFNDAVYWMGADTGTRRLLQLSRDHHVAAPHAGHVATLNAWIAEGHHPLPAAREDYFDLQEAARTRLRAALAQPGWLSLPEYLAIKRGEAANCVWL